MGKQTKSRKSADNHIGKGKVTPVQIAFIVDRYLLDNNFTHSRSTFRNEASSLIAKSPVQEAPRSLLSLAAILNEYITLKEQKVWMDQERHLLEQEKLRVHNFLSGMQGVMNAYNAGGNNGLNPPMKVPVAPSGNLLLQNDLSVKTPAGCCPTYNSPAMISTSGPSSIRTEATDFSTPVPCNVTCKRKLSNNVSDGNVAPKKFRTPSLPKDVNSVTQSNNVENNRVKTNMESAAHTLARVNGINTSPVQGSNVVKRLFNQKPPSPPSSSSVPKTPQRASPPQTENSVSPLENCSTAATSKHTTPQKIISANCTIISSETIRVSPNKQIAYYSIEKNHISACSPLKTRLKRPNTKDHVKGRLDFGASETTVATENTSPESNHTSESDEQGGDFLDLDLEALGLDFNLSEFFADFDMQNEELGSSSQQVLGSSPESFSGSPDGNSMMGGGQVISQNSSAMAGLLGENDMNFTGSESVAAVRSVTKCITILSPVKSQKS